MALLRLRTVVSSVTASGASARTSMANGPAGVDPSKTIDSSIITTWNGTPAAEAAVSRSRTAAAVSAVSTVAPSCRICSLSPARLTG